MTSVVGVELSVELCGRAVLVAGGGPVAARRTAALLGDGAVVTVVAPQLCVDLLDLVTDGAVTWLDREVVESDVEGRWLVHAATGDTRTDERVCRWATAQRIWSVCASAAEHGTARPRHAGDSRGGCRASRGAAAGSRRRRGRGTGTSRAVSGAGCHEGPVMMAVMTGLS